MHNFLLACEGLIAFFGVYTIIVADNVHERFHGIFVVLLAAEGVLQESLSRDHVATEIVIIAAAVIAVLLIAMSAKSFFVHLRSVLRYRKALKSGELSENAEPPKHENDFNIFTFGKRIEKRNRKIRAELDRRAAELDAREKAIAEREIAVGISAASDAKDELEISSDD